MSASGIYVIRNAVSGDFYIGSSSQCVIRERHHWNALSRGAHANQRLQNAYNKYGRDAFDFTIIADIDTNDLEATEYRLLNRLVGHPQCYNMKIAPHGGRLGLPHSAETRAKISASNSGRPKTADHRAKLSASKIGRTPNFSPEGKARMSAIGRKHTTESRAKMSLVAKAVSREVIERRSAGIRAAYARKKASNLLPS